MLSDLWHAPGLLVLGSALIEAPILSIETAQHWNVRFAMPQSANNYGVESIQRTSKSPFFVCQGRVGASPPARPATYTFRIADSTGGSPRC
jgi:hypothetical protein